MADWTKASDEEIDNYVRGKSKEVARYEEQIRAFMEVLAIAQERLHIERIAFSEANNERFRRGNLENQAICAKRGHKWYIEAGYQYCRQCGMKEEAYVKPVPTTLDLEALLPHMERNKPKMRHEDDF